MKLISRIFFSIVLFNWCISCKKDNNQSGQQMVNIQVAKIMGQAGDSLAGGTIPVVVLPTGTTDMEIKY